MRGRNFTTLDLERVIPDILHQMLLTMNRLLNFTTKAVISDDNASMEEWKDHLRNCLNITYNTIYVDRSGNVLVNLKGNECRKLRGQSSRIVKCKKHAGLLSTTAQRDAITIVWSLWDVLLDDNARTDPNAADFMSPGAFFLAAHRTLLVSAAVLGKDIVTPTWREIRNQNPYFKAYLQFFDLTLADCSMEAVEHMNKIEKRMFKKDLQAGGRLSPHEPLRRLMVHHCHKTSQLHECSGSSSQRNIAHTTQKPNMTTTPQTKRLVTTLWRESTPQLNSSKLAGPH